MTAISRNGVLTEAAALGYSGVLVVKEDGTAVVTINGESVSCLWWQEMLLRRLLRLWSGM